VLAKVNASITNPLAINSFIGAAVGNLTIDDTLSQGDILHIAEDFRGLPSSHLITETLPTIGYTTDGGASVLKLAQPYAQNMIDSFNAIGTQPPVTTTSKGKHTTTTTTTTVPTEAHSKVSVNVLNASTVDGIAHSTATALSAQGFTIAQIGDASTQLTAGGPSEILYGPTGYEAALTLDSVLSGPVSYVADSSLSGQTVSLLIAGSGLAVTGSSSAGSPSTTTSTGPTTTTTTTIPGDVYTNTQPEPWNPYPCTLGQTTQAAPSTTTTAARSKKS
jgi:hypothetical protein